MSTPRQRAPRPRRSAWQCAVRVRVARTLRKARLVRHDSRQAQRRRAHAQRKHGAKGHHAWSARAAAPGCCSGSGAWRAAVREQGGPWLSLRGDDPLHHLQDQQAARLPTGCDVPEVCRARGDAARRRAAAARGAAVDLPQLRPRGLHAGAENGQTQSLLPATVQGDVPDCTAPFRARSLATRSCAPA